MKIPLIVFGTVVALIAVMLFGSIGLSRFVRWLGWSQDVLAFAGMLFLLGAGLCLCAWRLGEMENKLKPTAASEIEVREQWATP